MLQEYTSAVVTCVSSAQSNCVVCSHHSGYLYLILQSQTLNQCEVILPTQAKSVRCHRPLRSHRSDCLVEKHPIVLLMIVGPNQRQTIPGSPQIVSPLAVSGHLFFISHSI